MLTVVGADGRPVPQALVMVEGGPKAFPEIALVSDKDGELRLMLEPGRWRLSVHSSAGHANVEIEINEGQTDHIIVSIGATPPSR